jgi:GT2 family glycosyltransferase
MIYYSVPYSTDKNLGKYYNDFMKLLPNEDDYACFVDGDTIFTTANYGHIIEQVVKENPEVGCFTCYTNRIGCKWQILPGVDTDTNDIKYHRDLGRNIQTIFGTICEDVTNVKKGEVMSGLLILLKKSTWIKIGGFKEDGMLGIDNDLHWKLQKYNEKIYIMKGIYLYHWYRWPNPKNKDHLL